MACDNMQKSMHHYENMRDSGVEWLGAVPSHWKMTRMKAIFRTKSIKNHPSAEVLSLYRDFGVLPKSSRDDNYNVTSDDTSQYKYVEKDNLVINKMKAWQGSLAISKYEGIVSPAYYVCEFRSAAVDKKYIHHLLRCAAYVQEFERLSTGMRIGQWDLGIDDFMLVPVILPPLSEQKHIGYYLDEQCSKIDTIILDAQTSIEEYQAWKSSIIYEAVTKGLNPNVEMKDSGIEWIGQIPTHWSIGKVKQVSEFAPKCDFSHLNHDSLITFTPMECIRNGCFENRSAKFDTITGSYTQYAEGDIVLAKVTPCFENGNICIMKDLFSGLGLGSSELFVLRAHSILTEYLFYYLQNPGFVQRACASMTGTGGLKRVSSDFVKNCPVPIPPKDEQDKIASFLNKRCNAIEALIKEKNKLIEDLESYKKSLIYEVVTGKRKVV